MNQNLKKKWKSLINKWQNERWWLVKETVQEKGFEISEERIDEMSSWTQEMQI
jgi:hypothetical protein